MIRQKSQRSADQCRFFVLLAGTDDGAGLVRAVRVADRQMAPDTGQGLDRRIAALQQQGLYASAEIAVKAIDITRVKTGPWFRRFLDRATYLDIDPVGGRVPNKQSSRSADLALAMAYTCANYPLKTAQVFATGMLDLDPAGTPPATISVKGVTRVGSKLTAVAERLEADKRAGFDRSSATIVLVPEAQTDTHDDVERAISALQALGAAVHRVRTLAQALSCVGVSLDQPDLREQRFQAWTARTAAALALGTVTFAAANAVLSVPVVLRAEPVVLDSGSLLSAGPTRIGLNDTVKPTCSLADGRPAVPAGETLQLRVRASDPLSALADLRGGYARMLVIASPNPDAPPRVYRRDGRTPAETALVESIPIYRPESTTMVAIAVRRARGFSAADERNLGKRLAEVHRAGGLSTTRFKSILEQASSGTYTAVITTGVEPEICP